MLEDLFNIFIVCFVITIKTSPHIYELINISNVLKSLLLEIDNYKYLEFSKSIFLS